jgi:hypothetical protein
MTSGTDEIQKAIGCVKRERDHVTSELEAWKAFREEVRINQPKTLKTVHENGDESKTGVPTRQLRRRYDKTVMSSADYAEQYDDSIEHSLREELGSSFAKSLCSKEYIVAKTRRDLLVATSKRIDRRNEYLNTLDAERESLTYIQKHINNIETGLDELSSIEMSNLSIDRKIKIVDILEQLESNCEKLTNYRVNFINEELPADLQTDLTLFSEFLYEDTEARHPGLKAIANSVQRIQKRRMSV